MTQPTQDPNDPRNKEAGGFELPNPDEVNKFHRYSDVDVAPDAQHHTLGMENEQASPGPHTHNGKDSRLLTGYLRVGGDVTPPTVIGSRGSNIALGNLLLALEEAGIINDGTTI